jgi:hypothetical protein
MKLMLLIIIMTFSQSKIHKTNGDNDIFNFIHFDLSTIYEAHKSRTTQLVEEAGSLIFIDNNNIKGCQHILRIDFPYYTILDEIEVSSIDAFIDYEKLQIDICYDEINYFKCNEQGLLTLVFTKPNPLTLITMKFLIQSDNIDVTVNRLNVEPGKMVSDKLAYFLSIKNNLVEKHKEIRARSNSLQVSKSESNYINSTRNRPIAISFSKYTTDHVINNNACNINSYTSRTIRIFIPIILTCRQRILLNKFYKLYPDYFIHNGVYSGFSEQALTKYENSIRKLLINYPTQLEQHILPSQNKADTVDQESMSQSSPHVDESVTVLNQRSPAPFYKTLSRTISTSSPELVQHTIEQDLLDGNQVVTSKLNN